MGVRWDGREEKEKHRERKGKRERGSESARKKECGISIIILLCFSFIRLHITPTFYAMFLGTRFAYSM